MVDGLGRDHQRAGDLGVGRALDDQLEHLGLARRQPGQPGPRRRPRPARDPAHAVGAQPPPQVRRGRARRRAGRASPAPPAAPPRRRPPTSTSARSYGKPSSPNAAAAPPQSPASASAYGSGSSACARDRLARAPQPERQLARAPTARRGRPRAGRSRAPRRRRPPGRRRATRARRAPPRPGRAAAAPGSPPRAATRRRASRRPRSSPRRACSRPSAISAGHRLTPGCSPSSSERARVGLRRAPVAAQQPQVGAHAERVLHVAVQLALARERQRAVDRRRCPGAGLAPACRRRG